VSKASIRGIRRYLNAHPELMDEVLFSNPSYVFFTQQKAQPYGAGLAPLTPNYSVAVDTRYIPMGACLLARVPLLSNDKVIDFEYRVLLAQDIGGAIKGPGRIDLYMGIGELAQNKASAMHHYGQLWLLTPKSQDAAIAAKL